MIDINNSDYSDINGEGKRGKKKTKLIKKMKKRPPRIKGSEGKKYIVIQKDGKKQKVRINSHNIKFIFKNFLNKVPSMENNDHKGAAIESNRILNSAAQAVKVGRELEQIANQQKKIDKSDKPDKPDKPDKNLREELKMNSPENIKKVTHEEGIQTDINSGLNKKSDKARRKKIKIDLQNDIDEQFIKQLRENRREELKSERSEVPLSRTSRTSGIMKPIELNISSRRTSRKSRIMDPIELNMSKRISSTSGNSGGIMEPIELNTPSKYKYLKGVKRYKRGTIEEISHPIKKSKILKLGRPHRHEEEESKLSQKNNQTTTLRNFKQPGIWNNVWNFTKLKEQPKEQEGEKKRNIKKYKIIFFSVRLER